MITLFRQPAVTANCIYGEDGAEFVRQSGDETAGRLHPYGVFGPSRLSS
jgi:hypothetical protein